MVIQLHYKFKKPLSSCWLDFRPFHHSILASSFIYIKKGKFTFQSIHLLWKGDIKKYKSKERHFVECVQICFFLVYSKEIGKFLKAGPRLSGSDGQPWAASERARFPPQPPAALNSQNSLIQLGHYGKSSQTPWLAQVLRDGPKPVKASFQSITANQGWPEALRRKKSQLSVNDMAERNLCSCWGA